MHTVRVIDPATGVAKSASDPDWTSAFSAHLIERAAQRTDIVAITAAMGGPTGLVDFGRVYPDRFFDVGIAEQHAVASASGLALAGMHPVVAVYSTFLNRAFDQLLMDVAMLRQPVTLVLDRAGVTGSDGASHNGMWDMSLLGIVPGIRAAAPRDAERLREELDEALAVDDGPTVVRFPKGALPAELPAIERVGGVDVLARTAGGDRVNGSRSPVPHTDVLIIGVGPFAAVGVEAAQRLRMQGITATVVDPRWVIPVPDALVEMAREHALVVTVEDGGVHGGVGGGVTAALQSAEVDVPCRAIGVPQQFLDHGSRGEVLADIGITPEAVARDITAWVARQGSGADRRAVTGGTVSDGTVSDGTVSDGTTAAAGVDGPRAGQTRSGAGSGQIAAG